MSATWSLFHGVENRNLEAWDRFSIGLNAPAVAAQNSGIRFRNPSGSNVVAVIEKMQTYNQSVGTLEVALTRAVTAADLPSIANRVLQRMDPRGRDSYTVTISAGNATGGIGVAHGGAAGGQFVPYEWVVDEAQEIPVFPGDAIQLIAQTVNFSLAAMFTWRERLLEESERA
jgi:hypothetical protein